jgi:hypothetical protein
MMKVNVQYHDETSLTVEEVVARVAKEFGPRAKVDIGPATSIAYDHIYFGIMQLVTHRQVSAIYDKSVPYQKVCADIRRDTLVKLGEILDQVIIDNETKVV